MQSLVQRRVRLLRAAPGRSTDSSSVCSNEVEAKPILVPARERHLADVPRHTRRLRIQRVSEAPSPRFLAVVLDLVSDSADPIPTVRLDIAEPGPTKPGVRDDDRAAVRRKNGVQGAQEFTMSAGAVVALEWEHALVQRDGAPAD